MQPAEFLTRWPVRLSLLLYAAALATMLLSRGRIAYFRAARITWTAGCVLIWLHLAAAFHFYHHWSHWAAYEATERDTAAVLGWHFGAGVYFNYLFVVVWTADVVRWWKAGLQSALPSRGWQSWLVHSFLLFMIFNATVTFGHTGLRYVSAAGFVLLAGIAIYSLRRRR